MNNLSWFLYLADTLCNLSQTIIIFSTIIFILAAFVLVIGCIEDEPLVIKRSTQIVVGTLIAGLLCVFIPSKNTMYAIVASELGESVIKSETGKKVEQALLNWIETQLDTEKPKSADK